MRTILSLCSKKKENLFFKYKKCFIFTSNFVVYVLDHKEAIASSPMSLGVLRHEIQWLPKVFGCFKLLTLQSCNLGCNYAITLFQNVRSSYASTPSLRKVTLHCHLWNVRNRWDCLEHLFEQFWNSNQKLIQNFIDSQIMFHIYFKLCSLWTRPHGIDCVISHVARSVASWDTVTSKSVRMF